MPSPTRITSDNFTDAYDVTRDILYMYVEMITNYGGFGHNIESGKFDPLEYVDCEMVESPGSTFGIDLELVHTGAGIAILCELSNAWDEYESGDVPIWPITQQAKAAVGKGRFAHLPSIHRAIQLAFGTDEAKFRQQLRVVYDSHVVGYFEKLLASAQG
jgi:hypothetical protein